MGHRNDQDERAHDPKRVQTLPRRTTQPDALRLARSNPESVLAAASAARLGLCSQTAGRDDSPVGRPAAEQRLTDECDGEARSAIGISDELLTVHDAARFLNVSASWIYEHTRSGDGDQLPFLKLGKYLRFHRSDLRAYIDAKRDAARRRPRRR